LFIPPFGGAAVTEPVFTFAKDPPSKIATAKAMAIIFLTVLLPHHEPK
jgi:hypothetical protein